VSEPITNDPATFDVEAFIQGLQPATYRAALYKKPALGERITELEKQIAELQGKSKRERSMAEGSDLDSLIAEHNALVDEFSAAVEWFEFRPPTFEDNKAAREAVEADGIDESAEMSFVCYQMAQTCISHPGITGAAFDAIRKALGDSAINGLSSAWVKSLSAGGERLVPFSHLPLGTPTTKG